MFGGIAAATEQENGYGEQLISDGRCDDLTRRASSTSVARRRGILGDDDDVIDPPARLGGRASSAEMKPATLPPPAQRRPLPVLRRHPASPRSDRRSRRLPPALRESFVQAYRQRNHDDPHQLHRHGNSGIATFTGNDLARTPATFRLSIRVSDSLSPPGSANHSRQSYPLRQEQTPAEAAAHQAWRSSLTRIPTSSSSCCAVNCHKRRGPFAAAHPHHPLSVHDH